MKRGIALAPNASLSGKMHILCEKALSLDKSEKMCYNSHIIRGRGCTMPIWLLCATLPI